MLMFAFVTALVLLVLATVNFIVVTGLDIRNWSDYKALFTHIIDFRYRVQMQYEREFHLKADAEYNRNIGWSDASLHFNALVNERDCHHFDN